VEALVRAAGPADGPAIVQLVNAVAAENRWIRSEVSHDVAERVRRTAAALEDGNLIAFVAELDGTVVGELSLRVRDDRAAFGMVVAAAQRGRGLGRRLLEAAIAHARERAVARVELEVYAHNVAALQLYRSLGFIESGPRVSEERSDGQRWEAVPMAKELAF
jgi:ribosomal protein S18 acetylase RimI-like enzyme